MLRTFSGKKPDRPPTPEDSVEATVHVHEVRYAALQQRAWAVVAVAGDETSARALGPATSEADAFGDGRCVFAAAATFEAPRDSDVTVTMLSGAGAREDAATVGVVRFSTDNFTKSDNILPPVHLNGRKGAGETSLTDAIELTGPWRRFASVRRDAIVPKVLGGINVANTAGRSAR